MHTPQTSPGTGHTHTHTQCRRSGRPGPLRTGRPAPPATPLQRRLGPTWPPKSRGSTLRRCLGGGVAHKRLDPEDETPRRHWPAKGPDIKWLDRLGLAACKWPTSYWLPTAAGKLLSVYYCPATSGRLPQAAYWLPCRLLVAVHNKCPRQATTRRQPRADEQPPTIATTSILRLVVYDWPPFRRRLLLAAEDRLSTTDRLLYAAHDWPRPTGRAPCLAAHCLPPHTRSPSTGRLVLGTYWSAPTTGHLLLAAYYCPTTTRRPRPAACHWPPTLLRRGGLVCEGPTSDVETSGVRHETALAPSRFGTTQAQLVAGQDRNRDPALKFRPMDTPVCAYKTAEGWPGWNPTGQVRLKLVLPNVAEIDRIREVCVWTEFHFCLRTIKKKSGDPQLVPRWERQFRIRGSVGGGRAARAALGVPHRELRNNLAKVWVGHTPPPPGGRRCPLPLPGEPPSTPEGAAIQEHRQRGSASSDGVGQRRHRVGPPNARRLRGGPITPGPKGHGIGTWQSPGGGGGAALCRCRHRHGAKARPHPRASA